MTFTAGQGRQSDQPADERGADERWAITPAIGREDATRGEQRVQALREEQAVDQPQVRVDGREGSGRDRRPPPADAFGDERGHQHDGGADQDRHELVVDVRRAPSREDSDSTTGYSGPCRALGIWVAESSQFRGSGKPRPRAIVFAVTW